MTNTSTVSTKGQVTIPENLRAILDIKPGDQAYFSQPKPNTKEFTIKVIKNLTLKELGGSLHIKGMKYVPLSQVRKTLAKTQASETWI